MKLKRAIVFMRFQLMLEKRFPINPRRVKVSKLGDLIDDTFDWDTYHEDILRLSRKYPNVLFDLYCEDTEEFASAHIYFVAGLYQFCPAVITYDKFNPIKLIAPKGE